jgi:hypothetical protein
MKKVIKNIDFLHLFNCFFTLRTILHKTRRTKIYIYRAIIKREKGEKQMDFSVSKSGISNAVCVSDSNISQDVDSDITLPEYVEDIECVLSCAVTPVISSATQSDGRITVEGNALIRLVYTSPDGLIHCFEKSVQFSRFCEADGLLDTDCISVRASTQYANCRLVNPRRFDVHGNIQIFVRVSRIVTQEIITGCVGAGVQTDCEHIEISNVSAIAEKPFTLSEVLEIGSDMPGIAQIVSITASPAVGEVKLISGKALIKGDMAVDIIYLTHESKNGVCSSQFTLPISQIVEFDGGADGDKSAVRIDVSGIEYTVRASSSGEIRLVDTVVSARAKIEVYSQTEIDAVTDAYSTAYCIDSQVKSIETRRFCEQFSDSCLCRCAVNLPQSDIDRVLAMSVRDITCSFAKRDGRLIFSGTLRAGIFVQYKNGEAGYTEKQLEYEYSRPAGVEECVCFKSVHANASNCLISSANTVDVRVELIIDAAVFEIGRHQFITDISVDESRPKACPAAALTVYYPDCDESVWEIAKRYNTTVEAVTRENSVQGDRVRKGDMLILPRM